MALEAIGVASSLIELAKLGIELSKTVNSFAEAKPALAALGREIHTSSTLLEELAHVFELEAEDQICTDKALEAAKNVESNYTDAFKELKETVFKYSTADSDGSRTWSARALVTWPVRESKINRLLTTLDRSRGNASLMLQLLTIARSAKARALQKATSKDIATSQTISSTAILALIPSTTPSSSSSANLASSRNHEKSSAETGTKSSEDPTQCSQADSPSQEAKALADNDRPIQTAQIVERAVDGKQHTDQELPNEYGVKDLRRLDGLYAAVCELLEAIHMTSKAIRRGGDDGRCSDIFLMVELLRTKHHLQSFELRTSEVVPAYSGQQSHQLERINSSLHESEQRLGYHDPRDCLSESARRPQNHQQRGSDRLSKAATHEESPEVQSSASIKSRRHPVKGRKSMPSHRATLPLKDGDNTSDAKQSKRLRGMLEHRQTTYKELLGQWTSLPPSVITQLDVSDVKEHQPISIDEKTVESG